jgi:hypothetical protein
MVDGNFMDEFAEAPFPQAAPLQFLDLVGLRRITGKIEISEDGEHCSLFLDRGSIIAASSSQRTLRLGHLLVQRGAVEPNYLHDVLVGRRNLPREQALGATLVAEGATTLAALVATVEEQIVEVLARALAFEHPQVRVIADEPAPAGIERQLFNLNEIVEAADRVHARRIALIAMKRLAPHPQAVLQVQTALGINSRFLSDTELLVALQIDKGSMTLDRLAVQLPLDPVVLRRTLISLMEREYVAVVS